MRGNKENFERNANVDKICINIQRIFSLLNESQMHYLNTVQRLKMPILS